MTSGKTVATQDAWLADAILKWLTLMATAKMDGFKDLLLTLRCSDCCCGFEGNDSLRQQVCHSATEIDVLLSLVSNVQRFRLVLFLIEQRLMAFCIILFWLQSMLVFQSILGE